MYVVDMSGATANDYLLAVEDGADGAFTAQFQTDYGFAFEHFLSDASTWRADFEKLIAALYVVDNNTSTSIGGGGNPRQPLAPPFQ